MTKSAAAAGRVKRNRIARAGYPPIFWPALIRRSVQSVFEHRVADALRLVDHLLQLRGDAQQVVLGDEAPEVHELLVEPLAVDRGPGGAQDLRVLGGPDRLALVPELLVHLLAGA